MDKQAIAQLRCLAGFPADQLEVALLDRIDLHRRSLETATDMVAVAQAQGRIGELRYLISLLDAIRKPPVQ